MLTIKQQNKQAIMCNTDLCVCKMTKTKIKKITFTNFAITKRKKRQQHTETKLNKKRTCKNNISLANACNMHVKVHKYVLQRASKPG